MDRERAIEIMEALIERHGDIALDHAHLGPGANMPVEAALGIEASHHIRRIRDSVMIEVDRNVLQKLEKMRPRDAKPVLARFGSSAGSIATIPLQIDGHQFFCILDMSGDDPQVWVFTVSGKDLELSGGQVLIRSDEIIFTLGPYALAVEREAPGSFPLEAGLEDVDIARRLMLLMSMLGSGKIRAEKQGSGRRPPYRLTAAVKAMRPARPKFRGVSVTMPNGIGAGLLAAITGAVLGTDTRARLMRKNWRVEVPTSTDHYHLSIRSVFDAVLARACAMDGDTGAILTAATANILADRGLDENELAATLDSGRDHPIWDRIFGDAKAPDMFASDMEDEEDDIGEEA